MDSDILKLEHEISTVIQKDNGSSVHFKYDVSVPHKGTDPEEEYTVRAYTVNNKTKEPFLLKIGRGKTKEDALQTILSYVLKAKQDFGSFTIIWNKKNGRESIKNTSYFYCQNILEALEKFFDDKSTDDYIIYEVKANPIS